MKVKLISYSQPQDALKLEGLSNAQELIAFCARVSNPTNQMNMTTSDKLIRYLVKHKHWSPLEMVSLCLEIETTRDIARQILRHRSFSFQEFSQRYADPTQHLEFTTREARLQDDKNRQNSIKLSDQTNGPMLQKQWEEKQQTMIQLAKQTYTWAINNGIARRRSPLVSSGGGPGAVIGGLSSGRRRRGGWPGPGSGRCGPAVAVRRRRRAAAGARAPGPPPAAAGCCVAAVAPPPGRG